MACDQWSELLPSNTHLFPIVSYFIHTWPTWYSEWEFPQGGSHLQEQSRSCRQVLHKSSWLYTEFFTCQLWCLNPFMTSLSLATFSCSGPPPCSFSNLLYHSGLAGDWKTPVFWTLATFRDFFPLFFRGPLHDCYLGCVWMLSYPSQRSLWNENFPIQYIWFHVQ